jgi:hypothetical protein
MRPQSQGKVNTDCTLDRRPGLRSADEQAAGTKAGGSDVGASIQITRTFWASSPLRPGATSNSTRCPSSSDL